MDHLLFRGKHESNLKWQTHCITQTGGEFKGLSPTSCLQEAQLWARISLFRALFCQVLKTSKDGDCIVSLGDWSHYPHVERGVFLYLSGLKLFWFSLYLFYFILLPCPSGKSPSPSSCWPPCRWWRAAARWHLKLSLLQAKYVSVPQLLSKDQWSSSNRLVVICWACFSLSPALIYGEGARLDRVFKSGSNQGKEDNYVSRSPGMLLTAGLLQALHTPSVSGTPHFCHRVSDEMFHVNIYHGKLLQALWQVNACCMYTATTNSSTVNMTGTADGFLSEKNRLCKKLLWSKKWDLGFCK